MHNRPALAHFPFYAAWRGLRLWLLLALGASACAQRSAPQVVRVVRGVKRRGALVSPYAYEWYLRGELETSRGDLEAAAKAFTKARLGPEAYQRAAAFAPRSEAGPFAMADLLRHRGAQARANEVLRQYLSRVASSSPSAWRGRLRQALHRDDAEGAIQAVDGLGRSAIRSPSELSATAALALSQGWPETAARLLLRLPPSERPEDLLLRALIAAGRSRQAERLLALTPAERLRGPLQKAAYYLAIRRPQAAEELLAFDGEQDRDTASARLLAQAALMRKQYLQAAEIYGRVPAQTDAKPEADRGLAFALRAAGLPELAGEVLETRLSQEKEEERATLVDLLRDIRLQRGEGKGALEACSQLKMAAGQSCRAQLYERRGDRAQAASLYQALYGQSQGLSAAESLRVEVESAQAQGQNERALRLLRSWCRFHPEDLLGRLRLAELHHARGEFDEARRIASEIGGLLVEEGPRARARVLSKGNESRPAAEPRSP